MEDLRYTLNDPIFIYGLASGSNSESFFEDGGRLMVVGGAASQLNMRSKIELLRPTTDADFIRDKPTPKRQGRKWAGNLVQKISEEGYSVTGSLNRHGAEVRFIHRRPDFILHLDSFGPHFLDKHKKRLQMEYERAEIVEMGGASVRYHSPFDVITNKVRRIKSLEKASRVSLNPDQKHILGLIFDAQFDDIDTSNLREHLGKVLKVRNQTVEDLGRYGYQQIVQEVENYKMVKDFYDISAIINCCRETNKKISSKEFKKALSLVLIE